MITPITMSIQHYKSFSDCDISKLINKRTVEKKEAKLLLFETMISTCKQSEKP